MVNNLSGNVSDLNAKLYPDNPKSLEDLKNQVGNPSPEFKSNLKMTGGDLNVMAANEPDHPSFDDESIEKFIHDKESIISPVKIKADAFKNKVSHSNEDLITIEDNVDLKNNPIVNSSADINTNSFNFQQAKANKQNETKFPDNKENEIAEIRIAGEQRDNSSSSYVIKNIEIAKNQITDLINNNDGPSGKRKNIQFSSNAFDQETMLLLTNAARKLEKSKAMSPENLNKINEIIDRIIEGKGDKLTNLELKQLKEFCIQVVENSEELGIAKADFQSLSTLIDGVMVARDAVRGKREDFLKQAEATEKKLENLVKIVSDPSLTIDSNFVEMLVTVKAKYASIQASGDPVAIAIYSAYLDKIMQTLENIKSGKQKDPGIFRKIQAEYENFSKNLFQKLGTNQLPTEEIKTYLGEASGPVITMLQLEINDNYLPSGKKHYEGGGLEGDGLVSKDLKPSSTDNLLTGHLNIFEKRKSLLSFTPEESSGISKVNLNSVRKALENEKVSTAISELRSSVIDLNKKYQELADAELKLKNIEQILINLLLSNSFKKAWQYLEKDPDSVNNKLTEIIEQFIANADKLQEEMDLSVDPSAANMIDLLRIFRKIIVELDIELKRINKNKREQDLIDENFSKAIRDNKERQEKLDIAKNDFILEMEILKKKEINPYSYDLELGL